MRIDKYLAQNGYAKSREAAKQLLSAGNVLINGSIVTKPAFEIDELTPPDIKITGDILPYVSRGGLKLERALDCFKIDVNGLDAVDIGASTGGFTDCLLQRGVKRVRAVDVGRSQLDSKLEADPRVISYESLNARYLEPDTIGGICDIAVCDVSFISLTLIFPAVRRILKPDGRFIALIKPQFEAGRSNIGKNGIVKDRRVHTEVIKRVLMSAELCGLHCFGLTVSPIEGGDGNREYLAGFDSIGGFDTAVIESVVYN
ncbi:MAG: TlyA family RNA methyltransferase [Clostridiales bacterium]|nr:TlyA family RNA methyltransferase [Clostridiales bacterium]